MKKGWKWGSTVVECVPSEIVLTGPWIKTEGEAELCFNADFNAELVSTGLLRKGEKWGSTVVECVPSEIVFTGRRLGSTVP